MKAHLRIIILIFSFLPTILFSQELIPWAGYMLTGSAEFYQGKMDFDNGPVFGGSFIFQKSKKAPGLELTYSHTNSKAHFKPYPGFDIDEKQFDLSINYLLLGFIKNLGGNDIFVPFISLGAGGTWFSSKEYTTEWMFSTALGGGARIYFSKRVGLFLRGRLLLPMQFAGASGWCGIGTGGADCGLSVNTYSPVVEGDFTGGIIIKFN
jgi:hypothetical protein